VEWKTLSDDSVNHVFDIAFSPDGKTLASAVYRNPIDENNITLWSIETGEKIQRVLGEHAVAFSPDGETLASGSRYGIVRLHSVATRKLIRMLRGDEMYFSIAFSPDGQMLAGGGSRGTITLWAVETGSRVRALTGHSHQIMSIAFSPDGKLLASVSGDGTIKL